MQQLSAPLDPAATLLPWVRMSISEPLDQAPLVNGASAVLPVPFGGQQNAHRTAACRCCSSLIPNQRWNMHCVSLPNQR